MNKQNPQYIAFCGSIAVGKTTIIRYLSNMINNVYVAEENVEDNLYLKDFYSDPKRWSFHSRISFLANRSAFYKSVPKAAEYVFIDRCLHELITFANLHYASGILNERDYKTFSSLHETLVYLIPAPHKIVYVHCHPETSLTRIKSRGRVFESQITIDYLEKIAVSYESWLKTLDNDVIRINTDEEANYSSLIDSITT
jgi:deoxyadenosine/deoxycytidine kinase